MTGTQPRSTHPSDGALLRQLDGQLNPSAMHRMETHLSGCEACRERRQSLQAAAATAAGYLRSLPSHGAEAASARASALAALRTAESARARVGRRWRAWAAAAAMASLVILSLGVDPLRAWVLGLLGVEPSGAGVATDARGVRLPPATVGAEGSIVSFRPGGATFELVVRAPQSSGEVLVRRAGAESVTAQVVGADAEELLVLPSGLRIENGVTSTASYRLALPEGVDRIVVRIGDEAPRVMPVDAAGGERTISLR